MPDRDIFRAVDDHKEQEVRRALCVSIVFPCPFTRASLTPFFDDLYSVQRKASWSTRSNTFDATVISTAIVERMLGHCVISG